MPMKKLFDKTFLRFMLVGGINTLLCSGLQFVLYNVFSWGYWPATAANYIVGSTVSYFLNKHYTFKATDKKPLTVVWFVLEIACCYFIAYGVAKPMVYAMLTGYGVGHQDNVAMIIGMVIFSGLNYLGQRFLVFRKK